MTRTEVGISLQTALDARAQLRRDFGDCLAPASDAQAWWPGWLVADLAICIGGMLLVDGIGRLLRVWWSRRTPYPPMGINVINGGQSPI